jgi:hypothetical protein
MFFITDSVLIIGAFPLFLNKPYTRYWFMKKLGIYTLPAVVIPYKDFHKVSLFKNYSGIYAIYCKTEAKFYIGSAVNLSKRLTTHFNNPKRSNTKLQKALTKYGKLDFYVLILMFVAPTSYVQEGLGVSRYSKMNSLIPLTTTTGGC